MSGIFIDDPGVRFSRRFRFFIIMTRGFISSLLRWLTGAACGSRRVHFRLMEAGFPAASQNACRLLEGTSRGPRAAGCASIDALRPFSNSVNLEDQHEISFIRETIASFARRIPPKGRAKAALSRRASESSEENILAASCCIFWKRRRREKTGLVHAQWCPAFAAGAQT
jgi:hypothetical protein